MAKKEVNVLQKIIQPLAFEFKLKDLLQIIIGASILAVPVGFTEETWKLGESLPWTNIIILLAISILFISFFVYYNYHRNHHIKVTRGVLRHFTKRIILTYLVSFIVVTVLMIIIQRAPIITNLTIAIKRIIIVTFPSSMSAVVADTLR